MTVDPRFERAVLAELALSERNARRHDPTQAARALAQKLPAGYAARVARAAIEDLLGGASPEGETLSALRLLPDPRLTK